MSNKKNKDMKIKKNDSEFTIFDTRTVYDYSYEEYKERCEENDMEVHEEDTQGYYDDLNTFFSWDREDFFDSLEHSTLNNKGSVMITGDLGLWNGRHEISPVLCNTLRDAIWKCIDNMDDFSIEYYHGQINVSGFHHDGCNTFELHLLSVNGQKAVERQKYSYYDYEPRLWWFKQFKEADIDL